MGVGKDEFRGIWSQCTLRNDRMRDVTGLTFRTFDERYDTDNLKAILEAIWR